MHEGFFTRCGGVFVSPAGVDAGQRGCGGVEISAFFRSMHYLEMCGFYGGGVGFAAVRSRKYLFGLDALKWAEMAAAKS
jgi:hypothetical protein